MGGDSSGKIDVGDELTAKILIDGSLLNGQPAEEIEIAGSMSAGAAITVDYDGWQTGDDWEAGAIIRINGVNHDESSSSVNDKFVTPNLWHVTACVGDCNNDAVMDALDIEPFMLILNDAPPYPDYTAAYPGLGGSALYHADMNGDLTVDALDIEPFLDKLFGTGCAWAPRLGGGRLVAITLVRPAMLRLVAGMIPAVARCDVQSDRIIDLLSNHTPPRHYENMLNACTYLVTYHARASEPGHSAMWLRVYEGLHAHFSE